MHKSRNNVGRSSNGDRPTNPNEGRYKKMAKGDKEKKSTETPKEPVNPTGKNVVVNAIKHDGKRYEVGTAITDAKLVSLFKPLGVFGDVPNNNKISTPKGVVGDDK